MSALDIPPPIDHVRQHDVAAALRAFLPDYAVLFNAEDVKPYECDGLSAFRQVPMVVALPATEAEVQRVHKAALLIDTHNDVPWKVIDGFDVGSTTGEWHTDLARLKRGGVPRVAGRSRPSAGAPRV